MLSALDLFCWIFSKPIDFAHQDILASNSLPSSEAPLFRRQDVFLHHCTGIEPSLSICGRSRTRAPCRLFWRLWRCSGDPLLAQTIGRVGPTDATSCVC